MVLRKLEFDSIIDVGLIVIAHFKNPAQVYARDFLKEVLALKRRCIIPLSTYLGAYIIMTRYLKLDRSKVAKALVKTLSIESQVFYERVPKSITIKAINRAEELNIASWDGYLLELANSLNIKRIYTIDMELKKKAKDFEIINPIPDDAMIKYHEYVTKRVKA